MKRGTYLTASRLTAMRQTLSTRDHAIVSTIGKLRFVTGAQIRRLYFIDGTPLSNARRCSLVLKRLTDLGVLQRLDRRIGGARAGSDGHIYVLGPAGQQLLHREGLEGRRRRLGEPGGLFVTHHLRVADLFVQLTEAHHQGRLRLNQFEAEPEAWRDFIGAGGARMTLKPDAFVRIDHSDYEALTFVEVDMGTTSTSGLERKFRVYRSYWMTGQEQRRWDGTFPKVLWLTVAPKRLRQLDAVAASQPEAAGELFAVHLLDEAIDVLAAKDKNP